MSDHNHFTFDNIHGGASDSHNWNAGGAGTFHGNQADLHIGGSVVDHGGHIGGSISGGTTIHATPNTDFNVGGYVSGGGSGGQIGIVTHW